MFISNQNIKKVEEGDKVLLVDDHSVKGGVFTRGHIFFVIGSTKKGLTLQDEDKNIVNNVPLDKVNHIINLEDSRKEAIRKENNYKRLSIIKEHCKHKSYAFDEYDKFDSCKLNNNGYGRNADVCQVKSSCEQYCDKSILRKLKIKQIKK